MILAFASKQVGLETLKFLLESGASVRKVVTGSTDDTEIVALCRGYGIPALLHTPLLMEELVAEGRRYDWLLNLFSPVILRRPVLALAERRVNLHTGLVPFARGNDGAAWTIRNRLPAGVSLLEMEDGVDTGAVWAERSIELKLSMNGAALNELMKRELIALFCETWPLLAAGKIIPRPQNANAQAFTRRQTNADRAMSADETMKLGDAVRWMLAHDFSPGTSAELTMEDGRRCRLRVIVDPL